MVQVLVTHVSDRRNRGAITRRGLLPRRTSDHNYQSYTNQPTGVFTLMFGDRPWWEAA